MNLANERERVKGEVDRLVREQPDVLGAVVCTTDGKLFAASLRRESLGSRLAAITSSLVALSETAAQELELGGAGQVSVVGAVGQMVAMRVPMTRDLLVVATYASRHMNLTMLMTLTSHCARTVGGIINPALERAAPHMAAHDR